MSGSRSSGACAAARLRLDGRDTTTRKVAGVPHLPARTGHNRDMRRRSLEAQVLGGVVVALLVVAAVPVVYVGITEGTAAVRSGLGVRALQMGGIALGAAVVAVVALAAYAHWLSVTERPVAQTRRRRPGRLEIALVGVVVAAICVGAWPVLSEAYERSLAAFSETDLAWTVGYGLVGIAYAWLVVWSLARFVTWARASLR